MGNVCVCILLFVFPWTHSQVLSLQMFTAADWQETEVIVCSACFIFDFVFNNSWIHVASCFTCFPSYTLLLSSISFSYIPIPVCPLLSSHVLSSHPLLTRFLTPFCSLCSPLSCVFISPPVFLLSFSLVGFIACLCMRGAIEQIKLSSSSVFLYPSSLCDNVQYNLSLAGWGP